MDDLWGLFPVIFLGDGSCTCTETQGAPLQISGLLLCKVLYTLVLFPMMSSSLPLWTPSSISSTQGDLGSPSGFPIPVLCCRLPLGSELGSHRAHSVCFPSLRDHCPLLLISISVYIYVYIYLSVSNFLIVLGETLNPCYCILAGSRRLWFDFLTLHPVYYLILEELLSLILFFAHL